MCKFWCFSNWYTGQIVSIGICSIGIMGERWVCIAVGSMYCCCEYVCIAVESMYILLYVCITVCMYHCWEYHHLIPGRCEGTEIGIGLCGIAALVWSITYGLSNEKVLERGIGVYGTAAVHHSKS